MRLSAASIFAFVDCSFFALLLIDCNIPVLRTASSMPMPSLSPAALPADERRIRSQLHALLSKAGGFLHGSLIEMVRRCGKSSCRCAADDSARHRSLYLGLTRNAKSSMVHVPAALEPTLRLWTADFQRAAALLEQLDGLARARLAAAKLQRKSAALPSPAARRSSTPRGKPAATAARPGRKPSKPATSRPPS